MQTQQISLVSTYSLQDFMALHFSPSGFRGRIMVGSRKSDAQSLYQVACYPVPEMAGYLKKMKQVNQDYYITANSFSGVCRNMSSLFALHNIVIDIDCHGNLPETERSHAIHELLLHYYKYMEQPGTLCANSAVKTGRGLQLWWAIHPVSVKCAGAYRAVLEHLIGQINHMIRKSQILTRYFDSIDAAPSNNLAGYFRLPGSYNTKSRTFGSFEILHPEKLDVIALAESLKKQKERPCRFQKDADLGTLRLAKSRLKQLTSLRQMRMENGRAAKGEQRDLYLFILYNSMCRAMDEESLKKILRTFNQGFQTPLSDAELFRNLSTSRRKEGYAVSNAWMIEQLQVSREEQEKLCLYRAGDRRGTAREAERERKRREKQERNEKILQLYIDGEGNYEQIASMAGCSKETVGRVIRESGIRKTPEQKKALILQMHDDQGMEAGEIAELLGVSQRTVNKYLKTDDEIVKEEQKSREISRTGLHRGFICAAEKDKTEKEPEYRQNSMEKDVKTAHIYLFYRGKENRYWDIDRKIYRPPGEGS